MSTPAATRKAIRAATFSATTLATIGVVHLALSCAGSGVTYTEVERPIRQSCNACHETATYDKLVTDLKALDDAHFTSSNFPEAYFPDGLRKKSVQDIITAADPPQDADIDPATPLIKAWLLHEVHELQEVHKEQTPPDYTTEARLNAFLTLKEEDSYEGCEMGEKLDLGFAKDPEGMPPRWAEKLLKLMSREHKELTPEDRQKIKDYVDGLIPGGLKACVPGQGSAS